MADTHQQSTETLDSEQSSKPAAPRRGDEGERIFTLAERIEILAASLLGYLAVLFIGRSLRWKVNGWENYQAARALGKTILFTFWHHEIFSATWFWRRRRIVVMASRNFDGEYIANVIRWHGYGTARGSSSRGAARALVEMIRAVRKGLDVALTVDGPRGPRHVAKPGVVQLAKSSGAAILCFHIRPLRPWVLRKSWDQTEIPKPFSPAAIFIAAPVSVDANADEEEQAAKLGEVQATLDGLVKRGEDWSQSVG